MNEAFVLFLLVGPAVLGLGSLVLGVRLLQKPHDSRVVTTSRKIVGGLCLLLAIGVGACYGLLFLR